MTTGTTGAWASAKLHTERKAGELLATLERDQGRDGIPKRCPTVDNVSSDYATALEDSGTTRQDAHRNPSRLRAHGADATLTLPGTCRAATMAAAGHLAANPGMQREGPQCNLRAFLVAPLHG